MIITVIKSADYSLAVIPSYTNSAANSVDVLLPNWTYTRTSYLVSDAGTLKVNTLSTFPRSITIPASGTLIGFTLRVNA